MKASTVAPSVLHAFLPFVFFASGLVLAEEKVRTCGQTGPIAERIADCARPVEKGGFGEEAIRRIAASGPFGAPGADPLSAYDSKEEHVWRLVSRASSRAQLWLDESSGLVWSDRADGTRTHPFAFGFCESSGDGADAKGSLEADFRLPDRDTFEVAARHGLSSVLPGLDDADYWTATSLDTDEAWVFRSGMGVFDLARRWVAHRVRCVASAHLPG